MSLFATPYVIAGSVSLFLGYKTYNSYYNQPFEYIEIEGFEEKKTEKSQEDDTISNINDNENNKIVGEKVEDKKKVEELEEVEEVEVEVEKVEKLEKLEKVTLKVANKIIDKIISDAVECETEKEYVEEKMVVSLPNTLEIPFKKMETIPENEEKLFNQYPSNNLRRRKKKNKKRRN